VTYLRAAPAIVRALAENLVTDERQTGLSPEERLYSCCSTLSANCRPRWEGLYDYLLGHAERVAGAAYRTVPSLALVALQFPGGWRESDLRVLLTDWSGFALGRSCLRRTEASLSRSS